MTVAAKRRELAPVGPRFINMKKRFVAGFAAVLFSLAGLCTTLAGAQSTPAPNPLPTLPPRTPPIVNDAINALGNIVKSVYGWNDNEAYGQVTFYRGYEMQVRMQLDRYRQVHLHRGMVINPRGYSIHSGDTVRVSGTPNADGSLNADMIVANPRVP